jgi:hypothetical protein
MCAMARHATRRRQRRLLTTISVVLLAAGVATVLLLSVPSNNSNHSRSHHNGHSSHHRGTKVSRTTSTTTTLPVPAAGFDPGHVTAVGDSVMIDYKDPLEADIPGVNVQAEVGEQWYTGESVLRQLKAQGQLGAEVIVGLSTNGPITATDFDNMMTILQGATRVVFVNIHVDKPWQDPNNAVLAAGATRYPNVVIADWVTLADANPDWFYPDETHMDIDGPGADALASLVASTLTNG